MAMSIYWIILREVKVPSFVGSRQANLVANNEAFSPWIGLLSRRWGLLSSPIWEKLYFGFGLKPSLNSGQWRPRLKPGLPLSRRLYDRIPPGLSSTPMQEDSVRAVQRMTRASDHPRRMPPGGPSRFFKSSRQWPPRLTLSGNVQPAGILRYVISKEKLYGDRKREWSSPNHEIQAI